jgi:hypothetical protein
MVLVELLMDLFEWSPGSGLGGSWLVVELVTHSRFPMVNSYSYRDHSTGLRARCLPSGNTMNQHQSGLKHGSGR